MATNQTTLTPAQQAGAQAASSISAAVAVILSSGATERTDASLKALARGFHEGYMSTRLAIDVSEVTAKFPPLDLQPGKKSPYTMTDAEKAVYSCSKERWSEACTLAGLDKLAVGRGQGAGSRGKGGQDKAGPALDARKVEGVSDVLDMIGAADVAFQAILKGKPKALTGDCGARIRTMFGEFHESLTDALKAFEADKATAASKDETREAIAQARIVANASHKAKAAEAALAETRAQLKAMQEQMLALQAKAA